jgi:hypothetical protein
VKEASILAAVSVLLTLASLGALVALVLTGPVLTLDGLSLLAVCLLMIAVFSWLSLSVIRERRDLAAKMRESQAKAEAPAGEKPGA